MQQPQSQSLTTVLSEALSRGATVITPNERSAADLRARFDSRQIANGRSTWEPAPIFSWNLWLREQWDALLSGGRELRLLLNPAQEHTLWREIVSSSPEGGGLSSLDSLASFAQSAWQLAASYEAVADLRRHALTHDARTFAAWAATFARRCEQRQYLSAAELATALRRHVEAGTFSLPARLVLIGFDDDTPARTNLLDSMGEHGTDIERIDVATESDFHAVVRCVSLHEEAVIAASWIRQFLSSAAPPRKVALIVPRLAEERLALDSLLRGILAPELESIDADLSSEPFVFSAGAPLGETALASTALDLLHWIIAPLPIESITSLLLSPFIGLFGDLEERASFDAFHLRRTGALRPELSIARTLRMAGVSGAVSTLLTPLATQAARVGSATRSYAEWMDFARDILHDAGFPGSRPLTAGEYQFHRSWERALDNTATLDFSGTRIDFATALAALERHCRTATASASGSALVQVISPSEIAGTSFDAIIFLRATDANWPASEGANPLIGWNLQRELSMPGTDAALTSARAEQATRRIVAAAPNVLFFYAAEDESGAQRLSPILDRLGWQQLSPADLPEVSTPPATVILDTVEDKTPLPPLPSNSVRGGALVLKLQAACAFHAFAELRLNASPVDATSPGFDARETGNFVHDAMDRFWRQVETQSNLETMSYVERLEALRTAIDFAFSHTLPDGPWDEAYIGVQKERLRSLLQQWLEQELRRTRFRVLEREQKRQVDVGPLTLQLRLDRVDEVEGGTLIVDYKTGQRPSYRDWETERPDDPQLPLYALLPEAENLQGLAFAKIRPGKDMKWVGYAEAGQLPDPASMEHGSMRDQIEAWRFTLEKLATDFFHGEASVSPKDFRITCTHCAHRLLCRLDPTALVLQEDETEGADGEL